MRRGHPGIGGWRNENPRHFRPRGGGTPHFRPTRSYGMIEPTRFPLPGPRPHMIMPRHTFNAHPGPMDDRNKFRPSIRQNSQQRAHSIERIPQYRQRQIFPLLQRMRHGDVPDHNISYQDTPNYYEDKHPNLQCHVNNMGDVDHRHHAVNPARESFNQHPTAWSKPPPGYDERGQKQYKHIENNEPSKIPVLDYRGHRPPSSDHYGGKIGSALDNSNTFSRSVNDTVDIVRKRLLSRESQQSDNSSRDQAELAHKVQEETSSYQANQQEPPKKKTQKRLNVKSNCDKIKNKIVHQLFMMDKDKIHKLMDNPSSSTKFEYAISSLITESQNSFNRHLRSVAEKSLCSSSSEFIHNDNNTIYEDTFMKQMQGILDPQDTILLEDIKPIVLAELSNLLQLNDFEHIQEMQDDHVVSPQRDDLSSHYDQQTSESQNHEEYSYPTFSPIRQSNYDHHLPPEYDGSDIPVTSNDTIRSNNIEVQYDSKHLFERHQARKSCDYSTDRRSSNDNERCRKDRRSIDSKIIEENFGRKESPLPLFDANTEQLSEEEDPFAELDRQYHVAVDHNFIEADDLLFSEDNDVNYNRPGSPAIKREISKSHTPEKTFNQMYDIKTPEKLTFNIKQETPSVQNVCKSPVNITSSVNIKSKNESELKSQKLIIKQELSTPVKQPVTDKEYNTVETLHTDQHTPEPNLTENMEKSENSDIMSKSSTSSKSRKRSNDQRPSHRKEKRKKSESNQSDTNKQILNKNIIINVNDCAAQLSEKCDAPKSVFNLFFSKNQHNKEVTKENKKSDTLDKGHSDKYIKRKETPKKQKDKESETRKKNDSTSSTHSIVSPVDSSSTSGLTSSKTDGKTKLKSIDMFVEQPRKSNLHQAHRNTASTPVTNKTVIEPKPKPFISSRKLTRRHIATQVARKSSSKETQTNETKTSSCRFTQTDRKKNIARGTQTDPVCFKTESKIKSSDTFERMKEIDMEIQVLLQEKFKLYSSLESKESCPNTMESLGMAVLNVASIDESKSNEMDEITLAEDTIVEDFTNIPVEELEEIALEAVDNEQTEPVIIEKRNLRRKVVEDDRKRSESPATSISSTRGKRKTKAPNISLIEQIITDDRPLEDIISLDDLENTPVKSKKKTQKSQPKPKKKMAKKKKSLDVKSKECIGLKECSVVILKEDISKYLKPKSVESDVEIVDMAEEVVTQDDSIVEEAVVNDMFDMLDVSEDIVIGDICEVKSIGDKDVSTYTASINEEVILDNSQSSIEEGVGAEADASDECKMYDYSSDENLRRDSITVTGNGDAVLAIECIENNFIAACLDGNVYYFSGDGQLINTLRGSNLAVTCLTIVKEKYGTTIYTGSLDSRIRYYDLDTGLEKGPECNVLSPIQTMDRAWDTIFVGTRTGFVLQFECKNNMLIPVSTVKFSEQSILALRAMKEGPRKVLLVAARSEAVTIKDAQTGLLLRTLEGPKMTVYTLLFEDGKVYCGTSSHQIHVFDYASGIHVGSHEGGKGAVCLRATGGLVFAGCYDGCVYVYREGGSRPLAQLRGPSLMLLSLAIVGSKIIAGYKDRSLYIWKIPLSILQEMIL